MHSVKVRRICEGGHPSEVIVGVQTDTDGEVELVVDKRSLARSGEHETIGIGYPVGSRATGWLIELPAEVASGGPLFGSWRVYVGPEQLVPPVKLAPHPPA